MPVQWEDSGNGSLSVALHDVQQLCIDSGFVFPNTEGLALNRRANLSALFDKYQVNSVSAFIKLFTASPLLPPWEATQHAGIVKQPKLLGSLWSVQLTGSAAYIGEARGSKRHGKGLLLTKGSPDVLYIGSFQDDLRHGMGSILTSKGEKYQGPFDQNFMWGPGCYTFPPGNEGLSKFEGMFNGRPQGKGILTYTDGHEESGEWDVTMCCWHLDSGDDSCAAVLEMAHVNAQEARDLCRAIKLELQQQRLWEQALELSPLVADMLSSVT